MKFKKNALFISCVISVTHLIIGNLIGIYANADGGLWSVLYVLFLPYTFIAGLSEFAGWDSLSFFFEFGGLLLAILVFLPLGLIFEQKDKNASA